MAKLRDFVDDKNFIKLTVVRRNLPQGIRDKMSNNLPVIKGVTFDTGTNIIIPENTKGVLSIKEYKPI